MSDRSPAAPPSPERPLGGGCLCGAVRYEVLGPFSSAAYCHCTRCQRRTGTAASASARLARADLRLVQGQEAVRTYRPADGAPKAFCRECGSALWSGEIDGDQPLGIRLGGLDGDPGIRPQLHHHVATAAVWEALPQDGLPRHADRPDA